VLYRLVLFPVTSSDPNYPKPPHIDILYHLCIFIVSGDGDLKFGRSVDGSKCLPRDGKPSLKVAWLCPMNHLNFGGQQPYLRNG